MVIRRSKTYKGVKCRLAAVNIMFAYAPGLTFYISPVIP